MALHDLLNALEKVKKTGPARYIALCPHHQDKRPSLTITEKDDGVVLIKCWAGCGAAEILTAVGLEFGDLYPPRTDQHGNKPQRRPWNPYDVLKCLETEARVSWFSAKTVAQSGMPLPPDEQERLLLAVSRLSGAVEKINGC